MCCPIPLVLEATAQRLFLVKSEKRRVKNEPYGNIKNMRAFYEAWQELDTNLETTVSKFQISDNEGFINSAATAAEMPEQFQCVLPKYRRIA